MAAHKKCSRCGKRKSLSSFYACNRNDDGLQSYCRKCSSEAALAKGSDGVGYTQRYARRVRLEVLCHYSADPPFCACCRESQYEFLSIDHIDGGGAQHRKEIGSGLYAWLRRNGFPKGFRVLCHSCNQSIGAYGYCPHEKTSDECRYLLESATRQSLTRGKVLSAAIRLVAAGTYPGIEEIAAVTGITGVHKHRKVLVAHGLWPCQVMPGARARQLSARSKVEIAAKALLAEGVYPSIAVLSERTGMFQSTVSNQRKALEAAGRWPTVIVGAGGMAPHGLSGFKGGPGRQGAPRNKNGTYGKDGGP